MVKFPLDVQIYKAPFSLRDFAHLCGIYFLIHDGEVEYIGRTVNMYNRLARHHIFDRTRHDTIMFYSVPFINRWHLRYIESELIKRYQPSMNTAGLPGSVTHAH